MEGIARERSERSADATCSAVDLADVRPSRGDPVVMLRPSSLKQQPHVESPPDTGNSATVIMSPALAAPRGACELKFLVLESTATALAERVSQLLTLDSHAAAGAGYPINTLYLDSPQFEIYRRVGLFGRRKFRLRRYGAEPLIWLEQKCKQSGRVRKRRNVVPESEVTWQTTPENVELRPENWFRRRCLARQLAPVCQVTYRRLAWIGKTADGPIRLTIDDQIAAAPASDWEVPSAPLSGDRLVSGHRVVEMKFCRVLPTLFRTLIQEFCLEVTSFSKYRTAVEACIPLARRAQCAGSVEQAN